MIHYYGKGGIETTRVDFPTFLFMCVPNCLPEWGCTGLMLSKVLLCGVEIKMYSFPYFLSGKNC